MSNGYFAAGDAQDLAAACLERSRTFFKRAETNNYLDKLKRVWQSYHGSYTDANDSHTITLAGEQGELTQIPVNHFRNIARHIYTMITSNRPIMEARAVNTDYKSLAQSYLANGILEFYMREKRLEECILKATEMAVVLGTGFIRLSWNATAGEAYDVDQETGEVNYQGDVEFNVLSPLDVVVDGTKNAWEEQKWFIVRTYKNKYDLMAKYPDMADQISSLGYDNSDSKYGLNNWSNDETDDIPVYEFFHSRTEAIPEGRYTLFLSEDIVLLDVKLPYRDIPLYRITSGEYLGTSYGYSPMFDILPIQEGINSLFSTIMTNQNAFGVQNIFVPRGADLAFNNVEGSLNIIEANAKPEALNLTQTPAEIFKFLEMLISTAEVVSGVNSVARGSPEASLRSGNALALVQSMALQYMSSLQQSYIQFLEAIGTSLINILKDFASAPRVAALVGKNNRTYLKEFRGEDINGINRVIVDVGNPLSRTIAGRVEMAQQLLQMNAIKNPHQYFQVLNTGRLDSMYEGEMSELLLIKMENEKMMESQQVRALSIDDHKMHIMEHKNILSDPDLRSDMELTGNVLSHIQEHIDLLRQTDPDLLQLLNQQPLNPSPNSQLPPGPIQAQMAQGTAGEQVISGPQGQNPLPPLPEVPAGALANPALQEAALGNVAIR